MTLAPVRDHVERGLSRLIQQYRGKPRLEAWVRSYLREVQALSDAAWGVLVSRLIDDAVGAQLTVLGRLVGEPTRHEDDERHRVVVRARIAVNQSNGHGNDILRVAKLLFQKPVRMTEHFPGAMVVTVQEPIDVIPEIEQGMLDEAAAGGVRIDVHFHATPTDELFRFGEGPGWGAGLWAGAVSDHAET